MRNLKSCNKPVVYEALTKNLLECHGYPARYVTILLSSLLWNHCPLCRGISVQFAVESVSSLRWNHCPGWSGIRNQCLDELIEKNSELAIELQVANTDAVNLKDELTKENSELATKLQASNADADNLRLEVKRLKDE
jgi:hypothetical protein